MLTQCIFTTSEGVTLECYITYSGLLSERLNVNRNDTLEHLEHMVMDRFRSISLAHYGFNFARADKGRRVETFSGNSIFELEEFVGKGRLLIIPKRDIHVRSPATNVS